MKNFIQLTSGVSSIDNSMQRKTQLFSVDRYPTYVRPDRITGVFRHPSNQFTVVVLKGDSPVIECTETPEEVDKLITLLATGKTKPVCPHDDVITSEDGKNYCRQCRSLF